MARRLDKSQMPEAVLVKMTPGVWREILRRQRETKAKGEVVSPPEILRRAVGYRP